MRRIGWAWFLLLGVLLVSGHSMANTGDTWGDGEYEDWILEKKDAARAARPSSGPKTGRCQSAAFRCGKSATCRRYLSKFRFGCWQSKAQRQRMYQRCNVAVARFCRLKKFRKRSGKREIFVSARCVRKLQGQCRLGLSVKLARRDKQTSRLIRRARKLQRQLKLVRKQAKRLRLWKRSLKSRPSTKSQHKAQLVRTSMRLKRLESKTATLKASLKSTIGTLQRKKVSCSKEQARRGGNKGFCQFGKCFCSSGWGG